MTALLLLTLGPLAVAVLGAWLAARWDRRVEEARRRLETPMGERRLGL